MKKVVLILAILALSFPLLASDNPPDVSLKIQQKIDSLGGGEYGFQYLITCEPAGECIITDQQTIYVPRVGPVVFVRWCNMWGQCSWTAYWPEG